MLYRPEVPVVPKAGSTICLQTGAELVALSHGCASKEEQKCDGLKIITFSRLYVCLTTLSLFCSFSSVFVSTGSWKYTH